jgi:hypothetical protein
MAKREVVVLSSGERLRDSQRQPTSMSLPLAVHHRLDLLAESGADVGATRADVVGMLIAEAALDPELVERAVLRYRKLTVGDVVPDEPAAGREEPARPTEDNVISIERPGPGRRRHETG